MIGWLVNAVLGGLVQPIVKGLSDVRTQQVKAQVEGLSAAAGADAAIARAWLDAQVETSRLKAAQQASPFMRLIAFGAGATVLVYFAAIVLDSIGHFGWAIAKLPAPWDGYAWTILQSFVVITPAQPLISAVSAWLGRKGG